MAAVTTAAAAAAGATAEPAGSSSGTHIEIVEGSARMLYDQKEAVFYNKVQVLNRDLSIQVIKLFSETIGKERTSRYDAKMAKYQADPSSFERIPFQPEEGISVLDALAATGLRSIRYMKEIPKLRHITINDLLPEATEVAMMNVRTNGVNTEQVSVCNRDATILMYENRDPAKQYDVIDLDPYGTAAPFLDSAVQAVTDGGLLCVTCTDMPVLSGNYPEVCFAKYGSMPVKCRYMHEMALRILLNSIESAANRYKRYIVPWVSMSIDFYVRVFVRVYESPQEVKNTSLKRIHTFQSTQCPSYFNQTVGIRNKSRKDKVKSADSEPGAPAPAPAANSGPYSGQFLLVPGS
jgi:tRNA (guanine26-N2/guanine27-N2)-dimethyltransferase